MAYVYRIILLYYRHIDVILHTYSTGMTGKNGGPPCVTTKVHEHVTTAPS